MKKEFNQKELDEFLKNIKEFGSDLGRIIDGLDIPDEMKAILAQKAVELIDKPEELEAYARDLLIVYLDEKVIEMDPEYQKELERIDRETEEEINKILNE